jgi:tetratricopeptide (TPR) repeat protein
MNQKPKEKGTSVAWFKLAELISRGEKEKALNLYRLLSHSFEEKAYALQVEGDILWSFEDKEAVERYKHAAFLYKKEKNLVAAAGVYEHLLTLDPGNVDNMFHLLKLYAQLNWAEKFKEGFMFLKKMLESKNVSEDRVREGAQKVMEILEEKGRAVGSDIHKEIEVFL